ncbi:hypothetical protein GJ697_23660 [Pseudoduganella sp. FT25W]|uniref:Uncharacterized protein n=1 Tax=Duganella alba TaxID=2666081 RepID=A0A6L5QPL8_9BURK|nr:hypothetical protein [Duganella alba]MRX10831.1 hypothetical protein [Duganella alba]MRX18950.1 hypothetical protein [Duganella alba]
MKKSLCMVAWLSAMAAHAAQIDDACRIDAAPGVALAHVQVQSVAAAAGDLPYYEARSDVTGSSVRIYHAPDLANAAASKIACFMGLLDLLPKQKMTWSPMVLTHDENYIPPKRDGELRWVNVFKSDRWDEKTMYFLLSVMPHEETHLTQSDKLPRWFSEGHAEWAGVEVTGQVRPDLAQVVRARHAEEYRKLGAAHLGAWGGIRVKPEAIERQLSAEDRERRKKDPAYTPPGPFSFGPDDFAEDNGDEAGRYGAALALFSGLEQRHGRVKVQAWVSAVADSRDARQIVPLAQQVFGEDITPLLR